MSKEFTIDELREKYPERFAEGKVAEMLADFENEQSRVNFLHSAMGKKLVDSRRIKLYYTVQELFKEAEKPDITLVGLISKIARIQVESKLLGELVGNESTADLIYEAILKQLSE